LWRAWESQTSGGINGPDLCETFRELRRKIGALSRKQSVNILHAERGQPFPFVYSDSIWPLFALPGPSCSLSMNHPLLIQPSNPKKPLHRTSDAGNQTLASNPCGNRRVKVGLAVVEKGRSVFPPHARLFPVEPGRKHTLPGIRTTPPAARADFLAAFAPQPLQYSRTPFRLTGFRLVGPQTPEGKKNIFFSKIKKKKAHLLSAFI